MRRPLRAALTAVLATACAVTLPVTAGAATDAGGEPSGERARARTQLVSAAPSGAAGAGTSSSMQVSANGRYVAFLSSAADLVPGDTNKVSDVFVRDLRTHRTSRVSVASDGAQSDATSGSLGISGDGRRIAFVSSAGNLAPGGRGGIFVHDRRTGDTRRVSPADEPDDGSAGSFSYGPVMSAGGRYVAFVSNAAVLTPGVPRPGQQSYVHDLRTGTTERVSRTVDGGLPSAQSRPTSLSADGRHVALESRAADLVPGDTNDDDDIFVHDRRTGRNERVSVADDGAEIPAHRLHLGGGDLSADGRYAVFETASGTAVPGDTNNRTDVFVRDRVRRTTERVSLGVGGVQPTHHMSLSRISGNGRYVSFYGYSANLVPGDTNRTGDVFLRDRFRGTTERVSLGVDGAQGNANSAASALDRTGRTVAFGTLADNLTPEDTNDDPDVFARLRR